MSHLIISGIVAYTSANVDYLIILMLIFGRTKQWHERFSVFLGDLLGSALVVLVALVMAFILHFIPSLWMLGLLGLVPIWMGVRLAFNGSDDDDRATVDQTLNAKRKLFWNVVLITIATSADNLSIFVPLFVTLRANGIVIILATFLVMLIVFCFVGYGMVKLPTIALLLENYGRWITSAVYIGLGLYVMWNNGTFRFLMNLL
ncbi:cadmium resistance transporter [Secundilactobacillus hailunensis]|uniref:Cadmium resistance transporter n=1 Tax=Secundilactobacillus hailunensis TaxID=2559923 RepID=A0ABW1T974_9LACO|nr:cadmium resistance transporter [Secundilactobacillus hailunensis]